MEHEKLPRESKGKHIEWWEVILVGLINLYAIASGSALWLFIAIYLNFSLLVAKRETENDQEG